LDVLHTSILEPFKVRHITRSAPLIQRSLHDLQKFLHSAMATIPCFGLLRETRNQDLVDLANRVIAPHVKTGHSFVSGDYSASTDNLNPRVSRVVVDSLVRSLGLSKRVAYLFHAALTGHRYRGEPQTWGQLMGSVVSFPVLCIANLSLTLAAIALSEGPRPVEDCGVLINGDDIGFSADGRTRAMWRVVTTAGGLAQSVGKNYVHRNFLQLNSKTMYFDRASLRSESAPFRPREGSDSTLPGHRDLGLFSLLWGPQIAVLAPPPSSARLGSSGSSFREWLEEVPGLQQRFVEGSKGPQRSSLLRLFLRCQASNLARLLPFSDTINWFVPRPLGGFGLEAPSDLTVRINEGQMRAATWLRDNTDPVAWLRSRVGFSAAPSTTTTYEDAKRVLEGLNHLLDFEFSDRKPSEPFVTRIEATLASTGRSVFWHRGPSDTERGFRFVYGPSMTFLSLEERTIVDRGDGLASWSNQLRKMARRSGKGRSMTVQEILEFRKVLVARPKDGVTITSRTLQVNPRTLVYSVRRARAGWRDSWSFPLLEDGAAPASEVGAPSSLTASGASPCEVAMLDGTRLG
jgi:hypothetical protein